MTRDEWETLVELMRHVPARAARIATEIGRIRDEMIALTEYARTLQTLTQGIEDLVAIVGEGSEGAPAGPAD